mgnify:CR=1 FL=1
MPQAAFGRLEGRGEIRDKDGNLKGEFTLSADCSREQAGRAAQALDIQLAEAQENGGNASHSSS